MEIETIPYDFRAALDDVLSLFQDKSREKHVELASLVQEAVPERVTGDPQRLRQVLMNLVRSEWETRKRPGQASRRLWKRRRIVGSVWRHTGTREERGLSETW